MAASDPTTGDDDDGAGAPGPPEHAAARSQWRDLDILALCLLLATAAGFAALGRAADGEYWTWTIHATDVDEVAFDPSTWLLLWDVALITGYVLSAHVVHRATKHRARAIEGLGPGRFLPLADRLRRWSTNGLVYVMIAAAADLAENALLALLDEGRLPPWAPHWLQAATWLKWLGLGWGALFLGGTWATGVLRGHDLNLWRRARPAVEAAPGAPGSWDAGRSRPPHEEWDPPNVEGGDPKRVGVSLSGGGIRSASFSLGALQALRHHDVRGIRYLTSVSGGGYMAAAWAAMTKALPRGGQPRPFALRSPEERWVRHHTDYLVSSGGTVLGSMLTLVGGLAFNLALVFLLLQAVAHPLGWIVGSAHPEMRAKVPIVRIEAQPTLEVSAVLAVTAQLPVDEPCDGCTPARRPGPAYEVHLRVDERPEVTSAQEVSEAPETVGRVRLPVLAALVAEGDDGLTVVRQPVARVALPSDQAAVEDRLEIAVQPKIAVEAIPETSGGSTDPLPVDLVRDLVSVERQPVVAQSSGTLGRDDLSIDGWIFLFLGVVGAAALVVAWVESRIARQERLRHEHVQAAARFWAGTAVLLVVVPFVARNLATWVDHLPGYDAARSGWSALGALLVASVPLLLRWRGRVADLSFLKRFRGRGLVLDGLLGAILVVIALVTFAALVDLAAANGPAGRLPGLHQRFLGDRTDVVRWMVSAGVLGGVLLAPVAAHAWSLYSVYRSGLGTAYFLAKADEPPLPGRTDLRYRIVKQTGAERDGWAWASTDPPDPAPRALPDLDEVEEWVVCTTANIRGAGEAAPGRAAGSFTFSRSWVGGPEVGWMRTPEYLKALSGGRRKDVSVPSTVTISGAAFSPAMGKDSKGWQGRLFALANLRLGVWVANPMVVQQRAWDGRFGRYRAPNARWYLREVVGWFDRTAPYVYLTDGGHWENLGLVELLRRGCTEIWMISAAGDGTSSFETLAQAIALAREELGVEFEDLELEPLRPGSEPDEAAPRRLLRHDASVPTAERSYVTAHYRFSNGPRGTIHIVEAALPGDLPWDVHAYAEANDDFPDIATGYQLMHHRDFEAYRMLGFTQASRAVEGARQAAAAAAGRQT